MVNPLSSDPRVWKILGVIFILLTCFFSLFFYFYQISIAFVIGLTMLFITKRLLITYRLKSYKFNNPIAKRLNKIGIALFWIIAIWLLFTYSVDQLSSLGHDYLHPPNEIAVKTIKQIENFVPESKGVHTDESILYTLVEPEKVEHVLEDVHHILINCVLIIPLLFIFYFYKANHFKEYLLQLVPVKYKRAVEKTYHSIGKDLETYFMTQLRTANAIALFTAIGFYIIGIKAAFLLAILTGVLHIIPHVGLPLAATVSVFVAAIQSPFNANGDLLFTIPLNPTARIILTGLIQVIIWIIYKLFLKKFFIHERIHLDPLLNIVLILVAAKLFGVMGMLFIIPIYFVYRMVLKEFYLALSEKET